MTRHQTFKEIPIAAAIMALTKRVPSVVINDGDHLASFEFTSDSQIQEIVMSLAMGICMVNATEYEKARSYLYRKARRY